MGTDDEAEAGEDIAERLEVAAAEARRGRFVAVAFVAIADDGTAFTAAVGGAHRLALVGAIERTKLELLDSEDE